MGARVPDLVSFAPGFPAPELFAWDEFRDIAQTVLGGSDPSVLQYGATRGYRPLVEALVEVVRLRGIRATAEEVLVASTSVAQDNATSTTAKRGIQLHLVNIAAVTRFTLRKLSWFSLAVPTK